MKKKILSLLLVVSMMASMIVPGIALENGIVLDCGSEISVSVTGEKTTVTALAELTVDSYLKAVGR